MWSNSSINLTLLQTKNQVLTQLRFHGTQNGLKPKGAKAVPKVLANSEAQEV